MCHDVHLKGHLMNANLTQLSQKERATMEVRIDSSVAIALIYLFFSFRTLSKHCLLSTMVSHYLWLWNNHRTTTWFVNEPMSQFSVMSSTLITEWSSSSRKLVQVLQDAVLIPTTDCKYLELKKNHFFLNLFSKLSLKTDRTGKEKCTSHPGGRNKYITVLVSCPKVWKVTMW